MVVRRRQKGVLGSFSLTVHATATKLTVVLYHIEHTQGLDKPRLAPAPSSRLTFVGVAILSFPGFRSLTSQTTHCVAFKIWNEIEALTALLLFDAERGFLCTMCIASIYEATLRGAS